MLKQEQSLYDNGDGSYTFEMTLSSRLDAVDQNKNSQKSQNGYFTATQSGSYLVELWGGDGAGGQSTSYSAGGSGGQGGHVYGVVNLAAGETLYYALGGNGTQTVSIDSGGGANGDGGSHGEIGSYTTGGGGGYSAVFKFEAGAFEQKYLSGGKDLAAVASIDETDRVSRYIMIAGGGGGGGAGNGFSIGGGAVGTPDGGAGGYIGGGSGVISGAGYDVSGVFFAGENGASSGTSAEYTGRGGTNVPGNPSDTVTTLFGVESPNDWKGTYNSDKAGGSGGSGNMRGGSGGAGFCGGSGGIMTGLLLPTNVGGGGGGSSFIADGIVYEDLEEEVQKLLLNENPSDTGGAVSIRYIGAEGAPEQSAAIEGRVSKYFDIEDASGIGCAVSYDGSAFAVSGALIPSDAAQSGLSMSFSLILRPKSGFAGGNGVPLFEEDAFTCSLGSERTEAACGEECGYVNVPLSFTVQANSYVTNIAGQSYSVSRLFTDNYSGVRYELDSHWQYDFIESVGEYSVSDVSGAVLPADGAVSVRETSSYRVSFTVIPKGGEPAAVGEPVEETEFSENAVITLFYANSGELNGNSVEYTKSLSYNASDDIYELSLNVKTSTDGTYNSAAPLKLTYGDGEGTAEIPASGWYMLQLWGGSGGRGGDYLWSGGGSGGSGGYIKGYIHLDKGDIISAAAGAHGSDASSNRYGGNGGGCTYLRLGTDGDNYLMIAGGGGGGGGAGLSDGGDGASAGFAFETESDSFPSAYSGSSGGQGSFIGGGGNGGAAGKNFISSAVFTDPSSLSEEARGIFESAAEGDFDRSGGGAVCITPLELDKTESEVGEDVENALTGYSLEIDISDYFTAEEVTGVSCELEYSVSDRHITVSGITPDVELTKTDNGEGGAVYSAETEFTVTLRLSVREGFLGGNDVPVLSCLNPDNATGMKLSQGEAFISVSRQGENNPNDPNKSDYANVEIRYQVKPESLTVYEKDYVYGDPGIAHGELFDYESGGTYTWEDDFVTLTDPNLINAFYTPRETVMIPVEIGVRPVAEVPEKASVGVIAAENVYSKYAAINVFYQVEYFLTNLKTSDEPDDSLGRYLIRPGQSYSVSLSVEAGAVRPPEITVTVNGASLSPSEYSYNPADGSLFIPAEAVTGNISITAAAGEEITEYSVVYVYETEPGGTAVIHEDKYRVNGSITDKFSESYEAPVFEGYTFVWDWGADEGIAVMPKRDIYVFGAYTAKEYGLTIEYVNKLTGEKLAEEHTERLAYGTEYNVLSPVIEGYTAESMYVSGTLEGDTLITVYYTPSSNRLNIVYIYKDSGEIYDTYSAEYPTGETYSVVSPEITGYIPDKAAVSGVMTAQGATVYVYYSPKSVSVTFDPQGGSCTVSSRTVRYGGIYGYDAENEKYSALPTPIRVGYEFLGWYCDGVLITEETPVEKTDGHTLTAVWRSESYRLTVWYLFENGLPAFDEYSAEIEYGSEYSVKSPELAGYTADIAEAAGVMPAQNTVITVTYFKNTYSLKILYLYEDGSEAHTPYTGEVGYGGEYSVESPQIEGFTPSIETVTGIMGGQDREITVYYYSDENPEIVSVSIEWGDLSFVGEKGSWNAENHVYEQSYLSPKTVGSNYITVTSNSTVGVTASLSAELSKSCAEYFNPVFTAAQDGGAAVAYPNLSLAAGASGTMWLWLNEAYGGAVAASGINGAQTVGLCRVNIYRTGE